LTEKILSLPNTGLCCRCINKIEWRKQHRKFKPLTQHAQNEILVWRITPVVFEVVIGEVKQLNINHEECEMFMKELALDQIMDKRIFNDKENLKENP
jgi:hypothetical protein